MFVSVKLRNIEHTLDTLVGGNYMHLKLQVNCLAIGLDCSFLVVEHTVWGDICFFGQV